MNDTSWNLTETPRGRSMRVSVIVTEVDSGAVGRLSGHNNRRILEEQLSSHHPHARMSRNSVPVGAERTPIHLGEHLLTPGYGAEIHLKIPATIEGPKSSHTARGRLWLTDQRVGVSAEHCLAVRDTTDSRLSSLVTSLVTTTTCSVSTTTQSCTRSSFHMCVHRKH